MAALSKISPNRLLGHEAARLASPLSARGSDAHDVSQGLNATSNQKEWEPSSSWRTERFRVFAATQSITDAALAHLPLKDIVRLIPDSIIEGLGVAFGGILLKEQDHDKLLIRTPTTLETASGRGIHIPGDGAFGRPVLAKQSPLIISDLGLADEYSPVLSKYGICSIIGTPLVIDQWVAGVIFAGSSAPAQFAEGASRLLSFAADRIARIVESAILSDRERDLRSEARDSGCAKSDLLRTASNRLQNNADLLRNSCDRLSAICTGAADIRFQEAQLIRSYAETQSQILRDVRDAFCLVDGALTLDCGRVDLITVIREAATDVREAARAKSIQLQLVIDPEVGAVWADLQRLRQVIGSLLSNAISFSQAGGQVLVQLSHSNSVASVTVKDSGKGINTVRLPYIFNLFRPPDVESRSTGGFGLAIVRQLVNMHGGTIRVSSRGENQGSTFVVSLPTLLDSIPTSRELDCANGLDVTCLTGLRVLLVSDDGGTRNFLACTLESYGAETKAYSVEDVEGAGTWDADVLVSDLNLPREPVSKLITLVSALGAKPFERPLAAVLPMRAVVKYWMHSLPNGNQLRISSDASSTAFVRAVATVCQNSAIGSCS
jgi:signal transduction histidine kinase